MPQISFNISSENLDRLLDAQCGLGGYQDEVPDPAAPGEVIPNPMSRQKFARKRIFEQLRASVRRWEERASIQAIKSGLPGQSITVTKQGDIDEEPAS